MKIIASHAYAIRSRAINVINLPNDADPRELTLEGVDVIELNFPKFTDGRAFSQAFLLRRRLGFKGEICALGDVLIDQLVQMQRSGFDVAVLREDQNLAFAQRQFDRYAAFYQSDAVATGRAWMLDQARHDNQEVPA